MLKRIIAIIISILIITCLAITNATLVNTKQITVRKQELKSDKISEKLDDFTIAYFSDLHYGLYVDNDYLDRVINKINAFKPDLIVFGGDLIDRCTNIKISDEDRYYLISSLKSLTSKYGKYAVFGNHDITSEDNKQDIVNILTEADFTFLNNAHATISINNNEYFNLVGINSVDADTLDISESFYGINSNHYTLCVTHFPDTFDDILSYDFDYLLAGHSHGGQIYIPIVSLFNREFGCNKYFHGKYTKNNKTLDITNGVGMTRKKARLFADNEIVIYKLKTNKVK